MAPELTFPAGRPRRLRPRTHRAPWRWGRPRPQPAPGPTHRPWAWAGAHLEGLEPEVQRRARHLVGGGLARRVRVLDSRASSSVRPAATPALSRSRTASTARPLLLCRRDVSSSSNSRSCFTTADCAKGLGSGDCANFPASSTRTGSAWSPRVVPRPSAGCCSRPTARTRPGPARWVWRWPSRRTRRASEGAAQGPRCTPGWARPASRPGRARAQVEARVPSCSRSGRPPG